MPRKCCSSAFRSRSLTARIECGATPKPASALTALAASCLPRQFRIAVEIIAEAQLPARQCPSVDAALHVGDRQQRQADARGARRRRDPFRQLCQVGVGLSARLVMYIVKLRNAGIAGLQHLDEGEGRNRLDVVRVQNVEEPVHDLAPRPEAVAPRRAACFGEPGHRPLESVAVEVCLRRQQDIDGVSIWCSLVPDDNRPNAS